MVERSAGRTRNSHCTISLEGQRTRRRELCTLRNQLGVNSYHGHLPLTCMAGGGFLYNEMPNGKDYGKESFYVGTRCYHFWLRHCWLRKTDVNCWCSLKPAQFYRWGGLRWLVAFLLISRPQINGDALNPTTMVPSSYNMPWPLQGGLRHCALSHIYSRNC